MELLKIAANSRIDEWGTCDLSDEDYLEQENLGQSDNKEDDTLMMNLWMDISRCPSPVCQDTSFLDEIFCFKQVFNTTKSPKVQNKRKSPLCITDSFSSKVKRKQPKLKDVSKNERLIDVAALSKIIKNLETDKKTSDFPSWHIPITHANEESSDENANSKSVLEKEKSFLSASVEDGQSKNVSSTLDLPEQTPTSSLSENKNDAQDNKNNKLHEEGSVKNCDISRLNKSENKITITCKKFSEIASFPSNEDLLHAQQPVSNRVQLNSGILPSTTQNDENLALSSSSNVNVQKVDSLIKTVPNDDSGKSLANLGEDINREKSVEASNSANNSLDIADETSDRCKSGELGSRTEAQALDGESQTDKRPCIEMDNTLRQIEISSSEDIIKPSLLLSSNEPIRLQNRPETPLKSGPSDSLNNSETVQDASITESSNAILKSDSGNEPKVESLRSDCMFEKAKPTCISNHSIEKLLIPKVVSVKSEKFLSSCDIHQGVIESMVVEREILLSNVQDHSRARSVMNEPQPICSSKIATEFTATAHSVDDHRPSTDQKVRTKAQLKETPEQTTLMKGLNDEMQSCLVHGILGDCSECLLNPNSESFVVTDNNTFQDRFGSEKVTVESNLVTEEIYNSINFDCLEQKRSFDRFKSGSPSQDLKTMTTENIVSSPSDSEDSNLVIDEDIDDPLKDQNEKLHEETNFDFTPKSDINQKTVRSKIVLDPASLTSSMTILNSETTIKSNVSECEKRLPNLASSPIIFASRSGPTNVSSVATTARRPNVKSAFKTNFKNASYQQESLLLRQSNRNPSHSHSLTSNAVKVGDIKALSAKQNSQKNVALANPTCIKKNPVENPPEVAQMNHDLLAKRKHNNYYPLKTSVNKESMEVLVNGKKIPVKNPVIIRPKDAAALYENYYRPQNNLPVSSTKTNVHPAFEQVQLAQPIRSSHYGSLNQNLAVYEKTHPQPLATPYQNLNQETVVHKNHRNTQPVRTRPYQNLNNSTVEHDRNRKHQLVIDPYQSLSQNLAIHQKAQSPLRSPQYITNKSMIEYVEDNGAEYLKQSYANQAYSEDRLRDLRSGSKPADPLCLVLKGKEDDRRETMAEYEFSRFPVGAEVEVCSADWSGPGASEIADPDWPIANEQNVDSGNAPPDPYTTALSTLTDCSRHYPNRPVDLQQVSVDVGHAPKSFDTNEQKEEFNLHVKTLEMDFNMCDSQIQFKEFFLKQAIPQAVVPVPFPPPAKSSARCQCEQCADNHAKLLGNYNLLSSLRNSEPPKATVFAKPAEPKIGPPSVDCSLPLKKRRKLTDPTTTEGETLSYPNTPMISIAQLADFGCRQPVIVPTGAGGRWEEPLERPAYSAIPGPPSPSLQETAFKRQGKRKPGRKRKGYR